MNSFDGLELRR